MHYPVHRPEGYNPDLVSRVISLDSKSFWSNFSTLNYSRPDSDTLIGVAAVRRLCAALDHGFELTGGKDSLGFLFLYELFTGTLRFAVRNEDSPYLLASYITCLVKNAATPGSFAFKLQGILEIACAAPFLIKDMPKFDDTRKFKLTTLMAGQSVVQTLLKNVQHYILTKRAEISRMPRYRSVRPPATMRVVRIDKLADIERSWRAPGRSNDYANASRFVHAYADVAPSRLGFSLESPLGLAAQMCGEFGDAHVAACGRQPIEACLDLSQFVTDVSAATAGDSTPSPALPFDVVRHRAAKSHVAVRMLERLSKDLAEYAQYENARTRPMMRGMANEKEIQQLIGSANPDAIKRGIAVLKGKLMELRDADAMLARTAAKGCVDAANDGGSGVTGLTWQLSLRAGLEATAWFELIVEQLLSTRGDRELEELNPHLGKFGIAVVRELTCRVLVAASRAAQLSRAISAACALEAALTKAIMPAKRASSSSAAQCAEVTLRSSALAEQLSARRHYVHPGTAENGAIFHFDPRFLVFEFVHNILLRAPQVTLVTSFAASASQGASHCEQMIMGGGKTCALTPCCLDH